MTDGKREDGGPAFPVADTVVDERVYQAAYGEAGLPGMSLRDYFAAATLQGLLASGIAADGNYQPATCARLAYEHADAMLSVRSSHEPQTKEGK